MGFFSGKGMGGWVDVYDLEGGGGWVWPHYNCWYICPLFCMFVFRFFSLSLPFRFLPFPCSHLLIPRQCHYFTLLLLLHMANIIKGEGANLRFVSWNVKGLNSPVKRGRILSHLKHLKTDVAFLQETHLISKDQHRLRASWTGQCFQSNFSSKVRGVAILFHKKIQFTPSNTFADNQGRFIIVTGCLNNEAVTLVNLYAPNWDDEAFVTKLISSLPDLSYHKLILGGDLNCAMDPLLDRSPSRQHPPSKMAKAFSSFMNQIGSVDPWRFRYPDKKQFSFYSQVHKSFSRIDYFFISNDLLPTVSHTEYSTIVISDHAPLLLDLSFRFLQKTRPPWRLNCTLLNDNAFNCMISAAIDNFLINNNSDSISPSLLWETLKVVIRGEIISYSASLNKIRRQKQEQLMESISHLDNKLSVSPSPELVKERQNLQMDYNLLTTHETEKLLLRSRGFLYEHGEKAGRLLAHQLKSRTASQQIKQIRTSSGELTIVPSVINDTFKNYYSNLYTSEASNTDTYRTEFLDNLEFPSITPDKANIMDQPLKISEITDAIKLMQSNKAAGPDGYPINLFKKHIDKLSPLLLNMFNDSLNQGTLPQTLTEASITLLLKPNKDSNECGSYRPISLLNNDYKILAKILALRLESVLQDIISSDQTGFMKNRHSFSNIRRLLNILLSPAPVETSEVVVSLDAEKAFDRVEWGYLFDVLNRFGMGSKYISWIKLLYTSPKASVNTNGMSSQYFTLSRSTRQGCPLSPLLFAVAIEPLSIALKSTNYNQGISRGDTRHILSLYADDLLLFVSDPLTTIPRIIELLDRFGIFSGYKLNYSKSECFLVNNPAPQITDGDLPFKMSGDSFKYLGVNICRHLSTIYQNNFLPLMEQIKLDLERWKALHLTIAGRINCIKMNVLPRFLYLFQCLPVFLPKSYFSSFDKLISSFIWKNGIPRIKRGFLQRDRSVGGLGLPNLRNYYWAANIQKMILWVQMPTLNWCEIEASSCPSTSLLALLTSKLPIQSTQYTGNPIVITTLRIWSQFRLTFGLKGVSNHTPICNNHLFLPPSVDAAFLFWQRSGLTNLRGLYTDNSFDSFAKLSEKFNLPQSHLFRYFQIRNFAKLNNSVFPTTPPDSAVDSILDIPTSQKGLISRIYSSISQLTVTPLDQKRKDWEEELGCPITDNDWKEALSRVNGSTSCARLSLIQFKVIHRTYYTNSKLSKIYPNVTDTCNRCNLSPANMTHMFWSCPRLCDYWTDIFSHLSKFLSVTLSPSIEVGIFGVIPNHENFTKWAKDTIAFASLLARRRILLGWKSPLAPSASKWLEDLMMFLKLEKIKYNLRGSPEKFELNWNPTLEYIKELKTLEDK